MRKKMISIALLIFIGSIPAFSQTLVLYHIDGTNSSVQLFTKPKIMFVHDSIDISPPTISLRYSAKDILKFSFEDVATDATFPKVKEHFLQESGHVCIVEGVEASDVHLYDLEGKRIPGRIMNSDAGVTIFLKELSAGVYLLKVGDKSFKIIKR